MHVRCEQESDRFGKLVRLFGVVHRSEEIRRCFNLVCGESLRPGTGRSSLNADGTPVQFSLSLSAGCPPAFEFVGEPFAEGMDHAARRATGFECAAYLATEIGAQLELNAVRPRLDWLADAGPAGDCEDPVGAFWIGASFEPAGGTSMTVYANARRGPKGSRCERLMNFASSLVDADWPPAFAASRGMKPLGAGVRLSAGRTPHVRVYFGAYGIKPEEYEAMFCDGASELGDFFKATLGADRAFPTRSAVLSFGSDGDGLLPKLELCAHCAWTNDAETTDRCATWLEHLGTDADLYRDAVAILTRDSEPVHAYVGVGMKRGQAYASIYLNPGREL